jgi:hypothetical protein
MDVSRQLHAAGRFTPRERAPGTHWIAGRVGPRAGLDVVLKRKIPQSLPGPNLPIIQPVAERYTAELFLLLILMCEGKGRVKLSLCLTKHHAMQAYWGVEV